MLLSLSPGNDLSVAVGSRKQHWGDSVVGNCRRNHLIDRHCFKFSWGQAARSVFFMNELFQWGQTHLKFQKIFFSGKNCSSLHWEFGNNITSFRQFHQWKKFREIKFFNEFQIFLLKLFLMNSFNNCGIKPLFTIPTILNRTFKTASLKDKIWQIK